MSGSPHRTQKSHEGKTWSVWAAAVAVAGRNGWPEGETGQYHNITDVNWACFRVADNLY